MTTAITVDLLNKLCPNGDEDVINGLAANLQKYLDQYEINTPLRIAHFLAQAAHETAGMDTLEEYASGSEYEGRDDLGNTEPGDGKRFKGRGIFQVTGRFNYRKYGKLIGVDLENNPELAAEPINSIKTACEYWNDHSLSDYADEDDVVTITKRINGGTNGLSSRETYLKKAKTLLGA
jgi:putative chitinase